MSHRRKFLQTSVTGAMALLLQRKALASVTLDKVPVINDPVVISTWDFGKAANAEAWKLLSTGGDVIDAVEAGVKVPEADPTNHSVGYGGFPDRDGKVTLDACIMEGTALNCGSVAFLENIVHPISVAKLVMQKTPHVMLVGEGALQFALANGFQKENLLTPESEKAWKEWLKTSQYAPVINIENQFKPVDPKQLPGGPNNHDTIGMLAIDKTGKMGGACTTSGAAWKMRGRVGDSPIIGAGLYVDGEVGAATSSGLGEEVIRTCGSHTVVELMRQGLSPEKACKNAVERIVNRNPERAKTLQVGFLALNKKGEYGAYAIHKGFTYSVKNGKEEKIYEAKAILT
ncbi:N(4)-(beta-N-acetylglucosaminyl)-L-asparaginase [Flavihumibacter profundi]|jgi:N4-(beta-N-acetylglucosaminyl)-L-asparaginase|uniref:N(4)-(beta-N-acetylglucosaminyl)-L-asparaginase n=1 Tax=Flavihumibacter profundi TaxID=2716883 RepID=UPI001CC38123|nr:N(4)-(beta-N-acetylglucosaminyl)-L-asparaginase [Flavihumibacter profundi]MBZ5858882.1 N(4)-(beta-N-acetylglucosaminyl)-L-asparaginase [Flavihumibacter profundi]